MGLEDLAEGAILTPDQINNYGLAREELSVGNAFSYKGRNGERVLVEPIEGKGYRVGCIYKIPKIE